MGGTLRGTGKNIAHCLYELIICMQFDYTRLKLFLLFLFIFNFVYFLLCFVLFSLGFQKE